MDNRMSQAPMWDARYGTDGYLFGVEPAEFLVRHAHVLRPDSTALAVADGEGRNSVYLASLGLHVTAFDVSEVGVTKARTLASERGVTVDLRVADVLEWTWEPDTYDVVVGVFIQFLNPRQRSLVFAGMQRTVRPGGRLLVHGYRPEQVEYATGGPSDPTLMYTEALLTTEFAGCDIDVLDSYDAPIAEGAGHLGMSALIDLVATKRLADT
jgi:SAM-dependent methyltransferase